MNHTNNGQASFIEEWKQESLENPYKVLLIIASILLSIASGVTTALGMVQFMNIFIVSVFITFGVQSVLLVTSWKLGYALITKKPLKAMLPFIFAFFMTAYISMFFSFAALFGFIYDKESQNTANLAASQSEVEEVLASVHEEILKKRKDKIPDLLESKAYQVWRQQLNEVATVALGAKQTLDIILRKKALEMTKIRSENQGTISQSKNQVQQAEYDLKHLPQEITDKQKELNRLRITMDPLIQKETALKASIKQKQKHMDKEANFGGSPILDKQGNPTGRYTKAGKGALWLKYKKERTELEYQLDILTQKSAPFKATESSLLSKLRQLKQLQKQQQVTLIKAQGNIDQAKLALFQIEPTLTATKQRKLLDVNSSIKAMTEGLNDFSSSFDYEKFEIAASACDQIMTHMNAHAELRGRLTIKNACDRQGLFSLINPINEISKNLTAFNQNCKTAGTDANLNIRELDFDNGLKAGNRCISLSGLTKEARQYRESLDKIRRQRGANVHPYVVALNAVFKDHEPLAILALLLAVFMDLLILSASLMGSSIHQENITDIKLFLSFARLNSAEDKDPQFIYLIDLNKIQNLEQKENMRHLLMTYLLDGSVKQNNNDIFFIKNTVILDLRHILNEDAKKNKRVIVTPESSITEQEWSKSPNAVDIDFNESGATQTQEPPDKKNNTSSNTSNSISLGDDF